MHLSFHHSTVSPTAKRQKSSPLKTFDTLVVSEGRQATAPSLFHLPHDVAVCSFVTTHERENARVCHQPVCPWTALRPSSNRLRQPRALCARYKHALSGGYLPYWYELPRSLHQRRCADGRASGACRVWSLRGLKRTWRGEHLPLAVGAEQAEGAAMHRERRQRRVYVYFSVRSAHGREWRLPND